MNVPFAISATGRAIVADGAGGKLHDGTGFIDLLHLKIAFFARQAGPGDRDGGAA